MSLTEEWKLGKKKFGHYYYKDKNGDECIARWWELNPAICVEILGKVPSYEHFVELSKTVEKLSSENQRLLNLNAGKESELKQIKKYLESIKALAVVKGNSQDFFDIAEEALR